ncbi:MAG: putative baseplate assembly protein [Caldilineaceae bacterium]
MEREIDQFINQEPHIDYLARDFTAFRQLLLDHLSVLVPNWTEDSAADLGHVLIETLAYAADYLSYYQDAVATEAYLDSARLRRSVRRHARLLDYFLHEGCNARVWVQVAVTSDTHLARGVHLLTDIPGAQPVVTPTAYSELLAQAPLVFATLHDADLFAAHNEIVVYAPQPREKPQLPAGATSAWLRDEQVAGSINQGDATGQPTRKLANLHVGDVLIFDEVLDPQTGKERRDPKRRHAVRLTNVSPNVRPDNERKEKPMPPLVKIEWAEADALPFSLNIAPYGKLPVTVARGNIVLADHGRRIAGEMLPPVVADVRYRPALRLLGLTHRVAYIHENALQMAATDTLQQDPRQAMPDIRLLQQDSAVQLPTSSAALLAAAVDVASLAQKPQASIRREWNLRRDLLSSDRFARDYLIEMEENEQAFLRFGFGDMGKLPEPGNEFIADYRVGNGTRGNIGPDTLHHVVLGSDNTEQTAGKKIARVWNPLMAQAGADPEPIDEVRLRAPYAFRLQHEQCITAEDYAAMAARYPGVREAVARVHALGLWRIAIIYIRRETFEPLSAEFRARLRDFMERYRQAGFEIDFRDPNLVPLRVEIKVYLKAGQRALIVQTALDKLLSSVTNADGSLGFFHPANFAFGQPVYRSKLVTAVMQTPGVDYVEVVQFGRMDGAANVAEIPINPLEVAELQNDPANLNRGTLKREVIEAYEQA